MGDETAIRDLRRERNVEVAEGQVYGYTSDESEDGEYDAKHYDTSFDEVYRVVYCDENAVFLKYSDTYDTMRGTKYRTESRENFEGMVGAGGFQLVEEGQGPRMPDDLTEVRALVKRLRGHYETAAQRENSTKFQHKAEAYDELLDELEEMEPEEVDLESVSGIGAKTAENLRENGFGYVETIKRASREEIEAVDGMGESNTSNLLGAVEE